MPKFISLSLAVVFFLCIPLVQSHFVRGYFVFTARLSCKIPEKHNFRYQIQYWLGGVVQYYKKMTFFDNIGNGTNGEVLVNNFAKMYANTFFMFASNPYAIILHDCTTKKGKMRKFTNAIFDKNCPDGDKNCQLKMRLDLTDLGDMVAAERINDIDYKAGFATEPTGVFI